MTVEDIKMPGVAGLVCIGVPHERATAVPGLVSHFEDRDDFLLSPTPFDHAMYLVGLEQRGVRGTDLVRLIRRSTAAGIAGIGPATHPDVVAALDAGADVVLHDEVSTDQLAAALRALRRRIDTASYAFQPNLWIFSEEQATLTGPGGKVLPLSDGEVSVLRCFAEAGGAPVTRATLMRALWGDDTAGMDNALHAALYRLRKRMEQATPIGSPLHAVARFGYEFRAPLARG